MSREPAPTPGPGETVNPTQSARSDGSAAQDAQATLAQWQRELGATGGANSLLWSDAGVALDITHAHPGGLAKLLAGKTAKLTELYREPAARERAIARARVIREKELELDRERGVPGCFLAAGRATWTERRGPVPNAPVFLRRCSLLPEDHAQQEFAVVVSQDLEFNPVLRSFLERIGGQDFPFDALVRMSLRPNGFDPTEAYAALTRSWAGPPGWRVTADLWIATFPYAKLGALTDFHGRQPWLAQHPVVGPLAVGGEEPRPARSALARDPEAVTVLDADPGQLAVLEAVQAGETVVVDAGPGTGKTQTIVNVAADLARSGRSTLIVAAPSGGRAAIVGRLHHLGLGGLLVEPGANESAAKASRPAPAAARPQADFSSAGRELSDHVAAMHDIREPWGCSVDSLQDRIAGICEGAQPPRSKVRITGAPLAQLDEAAMRSWSQRFTALAEAGTWTAEDDTDPWWGVRIDGPDDLAAAQAALEALSPRALQTLAKELRLVLTGVTAPVLDSLAAQEEFLTGLEDIAEVLERFRLGVFDAPLEDWVGHGPAGAVDRWRHGRAVKSLLRPGLPPTDIQSLLATALRVRPLWLSIRGSEVLPGQIGGLDRARQVVAETLAHATRLGAMLPGAPDLTREPLGRLKERITGLSARRARLEVLAAAAPDLHRAREAGLGELVEDFADRGVTATQVPDETEFVWLASVLAQITANDATYARASGDAVRAAAGRFRELDRTRQRATAAGLAADRAGQEPLIWVCSPYAVGLHLPAERGFDLVLVDEAQALSPAVAAGALARADQAVIVGDRALPGPTAFTATAGGTSDVVRPESLLDRAAARWPVHRLSWHYRSHSADLVEVVARHAYADALTLFPAPVAGEAVRVRHIGRSAEDRKLVAAAIEELHRHARLHPGESLAVLTVDPALADAVRAGLAASREPCTSSFFDVERSEPLVIITGDRAAGVVRDATLVLLGESTPGRVSTPVGVRGLTAALSRARSRQTVLHSLDPASITELAAAESDGFGLRMLADVLTGNRPEPMETEPTVLVRDLMRRLLGRGLRVQAGVVPGLVDLAVRDAFSASAPSLAVQIDGPAYHALGGSRMRDRLVYEQLRRLGWRPLHILSVDLFRDPAREEARIVAAVERLGAGEPHTGAVTSRPARRASRPATGGIAEDDAASAGIPAHKRRSLDRPEQTRPEQTQDDTPAGWGESASDPAHDQWLQDNRPPHWG